MKTVKDINSKNVLIKEMKKGAISFVLKIENFIKSGELVFVSEYDKPRANPNDLVSQAVYKCPNLGYNAELIIETRVYEGVTTKGVSLSYYQNENYEGLVVKSAKPVSIPA